MAQYRFSPMGPEQPKPDKDNYPREGLVNDVCKEWLMHEDQALAYRLQTEEYKHHLGHNRERNAILRKDTPKAREEQIKADEEAARTQTAIELDLAKQESCDAALAAAMAEDLEAQEREHEHEQQTRDIQLAKKIMEEEKLRVRQSREIRQVEREAAYLGINSGLDNVAILSRKDKRQRRGGKGWREEPTKDAVNPNLSDLSDFCLKPSSSMDEEEMRRLQEEQDEELARLMQEQDLKRRGDMLQEDQLQAIEQQDKELAKVLQEQEKAKAKKAREKARQKALAKKQRNQLERSRSDSSGAEMSADGSSHYASIEPRLETPPPSTSPSPPPTRRPLNRPPSPQYATPILRPQASMSPARPHSLVLSHPPPPMEHYSQREIRTPDNTAHFGRQEIRTPDNGTHFGRQELRTPDNAAHFVRQELRTPDNAAHFVRQELRTPDNYAPRIDPLRDAAHHQPTRRPLVGRGNSPPNSAPASQFTNIACVIDPTYERRVKQGQLSSPPAYGISSAHSPPSQSLSPSTPVEFTQPAAHPPPPVFDDEDDYLPPPYMPIQGQRRLNSLEKTKSKKDSCKQQ